MGNLKKENVYVVVDTPKKAKKLKKFLDMFGERIYNETNERLSKNEVSEEYPIIHLSRGRWAGYGCKSYQSKKQVSIKELRSILAKEHLKVGDYFVDCNKYVFVINKLNDDETIDCSCLTHNTKGDLSYEDFKRYATPEEIALLEPKEVDKFAELKEAHKNGAKIEYLHIRSNVWLDCENPGWYNDCEYRIKPEEKPKVGDVVKAWDNELDGYTIGKVVKISGIGYFLQDDLWWDNAKTLTQQEAIDLLFIK